MTRFVLILLTNSWLSWNWSWEDCWTKSSQNVSGKIEVDRNMYLNESELLNKEPFSTENKLQARTKLTNDTKKLLLILQTFQTRTNFQTKTCVQTRTKKPRKILKMVILREIKSCYKKCALKILGIFERTSRKTKTSWSQSDQLQFHPSQYWHEYILLYIQIILPGLLLHWQICVTPHRRRHIHRAGRSSPDLSCISITTSSAKYLKKWFMEDVLVGISCTH